MKWKKNNNKRNQPSSSVCMCVCVCVETNKLYYGKTFSLKWKHFESWKLNPKIQNACFLLFIQFFLSFFYQTICNIWRCFFPSRNVVAATIKNPKCLRMRKIEDFWYRHYVYRILYKCVYLRIYQNVDIFYSLYASFSAEQRGSNWINFNELRKRRRRRSGNYCN